MAKRWVRDDFDGAEEDALLQGRVTPTGQEWGKGSEIWEEGEVAGYGYTSILTTDDGGVFFEGYETTNFHQAKHLLIDAPNFDREAHNVYEWRLDRFPDEPGLPHPPDFPGYFYTPSEALLVFDSLGAPPWGGGIQTNAVRIKWDWYQQKVIVGEPAKSNDSVLAYSMYNPAAWYEPLPALDDPAHPDEYYFRFETTWDDGSAGYMCSLWLNDDLVYEDKSFSGWSHPTHLAAGLGFTIGTIDGYSYTPFIASLRNRITFREFRFNYTPVSLETGVPLNQMARKDGLNASGEYQMNQQGVGRTGGPIWQLSGQ